MGLCGNTGIQVVWLIWSYIIDVKIYYVFM